MDFVLLQYLDFIWFKYMDRAWADTAQRKHDIF
jgi:hypothetical protein